MKILIIENDWMFKNLPGEIKERFSFILEMGWGNGYALIPRDHPLYGLHYDEINTVVDVRGSLTFSRMITGRNYKFYGLSKRHLGKWIVGFDTMHAWDNKTNWSKEHVLAETYALRNQLLNLNNVLHKP